MSAQINAAYPPRVSKGRFHDVDEVKAWAMAREQRAAFFKAKALRLRYHSEQRVKAAVAAQTRSGQSQPLAA